jgi:hypothetical protein
MERGHALVIEGHFATNQNIKNNAKTPYVNFRASISSGLQQFRSSEI